jgi:hypothetical protein
MPLQRRWAEVFLSPSVSASLHASLHPPCIRIDRRASLSLLTHLNPSTVYELLPCSTLELYAMTLASPLNKQKSGVRVR